MQQTFGPTHRRKIFMTAVFIQMETHYILGRCKNTVVANT